jgi:hypothetical protein
VADGGRFFDTNVILCLASEDAAKTGHAEELLAEGGTISAQMFHGRHAARSHDRRRAHDARSFSLMTQLFGLPPMKQ